MAKRKPEKTVSPVAYWVAEIAAAKKRESDYRKDGQRIIDIYEGKKKEETPFNILFSNVETLLPALYSATPRPVVERRFKDADPIGKAASEAGKRGLEYLLDTNVEGYETFDQGMKAATLDALLPGRGVTCVKYDAEIGELPSLSVDADEPEEAEEKTAEKKEETPPDEYKKSELVCLDTRSWNRLLFGYAKKWSKVPWAAYEEHIDEDEAVRLFGKEMAANLVFSAEEADEDNEKTDEKNRGERKTTTVYQIWDRAGGKKIRYISPGYADNYLKVLDDTLGVTGFFNCPQPLQFIEKSNDLLPVSPYILYEEQAQELNEITRRIKRIVRAIKAKGIYDSSLGEDVKNLVEAADNELVPADQSASMVEGGIDKAIWFWPVDKLITVLRELMNAREACKQVIYEITGIADIMRGQTNASETLGAQQIKQSWGTLRLKRQQKEVQRYARDLLRMMLEVAANKFSEETWSKMTGLPYLTTQQVQELTAQFQAMQAQAMQQPAQQPQVQQPGQPPPQPSPLQMQMQQLQQKLQTTPKWSDVLGVLKDDVQRSYRIDIETNSTVEPEAVEDQKNITELMTAIGQYLNGIGPLVANGTMPFQAAQSMLLAICRRYRFGSEIEDYIMQMQAPKPQDDGKAQAEQAKLAAQQQNEQARQQQEQQRQAAEQQRLQQAEEAKNAREQQAEANRNAQEQARLNAEHQQKLAEIQANKDAALAKTQSERATAEFKARLDAKQSYKDALLKAAVAIETARISASKDGAEGSVPTAGLDIQKLVQDIEVAVGGVA